MENPNKVIPASGATALDEKSSPQVFDAETVGLSLREVGADVLRGETTDFLSRWFHSSFSDADLVIWTDGQQRIIKYQLCFFGQVVEWNPIHGTRTGYIFEEEVSGEEVPGLEVSESVRYDRDAQDSVVVQASEILSFVAELSDDDRYKLIFNLRESPRLHKRARERALQAWAPRIDEIVSNQPASLWRRLKKWVLGD
jgi:hypothetical protein